jgi:anti-sigma factor RsiW
MPAPVDDTLLCAYVDGELDPEKSREIELLAARNPEVRGRIEMYRRSASLLRQALSDSRFTEVPPRIRQAADRAILRSRLRRHLSAAAALVLGLGIGAAVTWLAIEQGFLPRDPVGQIMRDVADYHPIYTREDEHLVEVPASRREHIEVWLGERVGYPLKAPDLDAYGLRFEGARLVALHNHALAQLMYTGRQGQRIALCVTRASGPSTERRESMLEQAGLRLHAAGRGHHVFVVVGPADEPVLDRLAPGLPALLTRS